MYIYDCVLGGLGLVIPRPVDPIADHFARWCPLQGPVTSWLPLGP